MEFIFFWLPILGLIAVITLFRDMGKDAKRLDLVTWQSFSLYFVTTLTILIAVYLGITLAISVPKINRFEQLPKQMWADFNPAFILQLFGSRFSMWEFLTVMGNCVIFAYVFTNFAFYHTSGLKDQKLISSYVESAWYYEAWTEKCTRIVTKTVNGKTTYHTETYLQDHAPYWQIILADGQVLSISKGDFINYVAKFGNKEKQYISRPSQYSKNDGNAFCAVWPKTDQTMVPAAYSKDYFSYISASEHTILVSRGDEARYKNFLVEYPDVIDSGFGEIDIDRVLTPGIQFDEQFAQQMDDLLSVYLAKNTQKKDVNILLYVTNQPITVWDAIHEQWRGSKFNDVIVVVSVDDQTRRLNWVKTISWDNVALCSEIDNRLMQLSYFTDANAICSIITSAVDTLYIKPNMDKYSYLASDVQLPWYSVLLYSFGSGLVSSALVAYFYHFGFAEAWAPFEAMLTELLEWVKMQLR